MSVYVNSMRTCLRSKRWKWKASCHLIADSVVELHQFASNRLGFTRDWFQPDSTPHYDLTENRRRAAIAAGAEPLSDRQFVDVIRRLRAESRCPSNP